MTGPNTLLLRLEGPLQAWGDNQSKLLVRRTAQAPTKSGVLGILLAALGVSRSEAPKHWLPRLALLLMGVRTDAPGARWWDYQTVGAGMKMRTADGRSKPGAMLTRREYLCDASFLVALQGQPALIAELERALKAPKWTVYLGRKCCPPSRPVLEAPGTVESPGLLCALRAVPWRARLKNDPPPQALECLLDWEPSEDRREAPGDALVWYDVPSSLEPPSHQPRFVVRKQLLVGADGGVALAAPPVQTETPQPPRPRADYRNTEYRKRRQNRLAADHHLCVFCKAPAHTAQHVTYRRAGGNEAPDDLRAMCRLCHDAVTMIEYGLGMGLDRIDPEDPRWRAAITEKRAKIIAFRSMETRRRRLSAEEAE